MTAQLLSIDAEPPAVDAIETLEEVMELARAGNLSSVAIAVVFRDGATSRSWSSAPSMALLIGAVARLQCALCARMDED